MTSGKRIWRQLSTSLIVAIGIALVWGVLVGWGGAVVDTILWPRNITYEQIVLTAQGTPLIYTRTRFVNDDQFSQTYRTLDGQSATVRSGERLNRKNLQAPVEPPGLWYLPIEWKYRVAGISDLGKPQVGWCLIRDDQPSGQAYLVGYEMKTKQFVGTIGRNGFCSSMPPEEERFEHDSHPYGRMMGSACTSGYISYGRAAPRHQYNQIVFHHDIPQWLLFLIDGDRLQEIDLRSRKVRTLFQSPDLVGVSLLTAKDNSAEDGKKRAVHRLMVRLTDRVVILDRTTGDKQEYLLPESMRRQQLSAYAIDDGQLLLVSKDYGAGKEGRKKVKLVWFSPDGQTTQEKEVSLLWTGQSMSKHAQVVVAGLAAPIPLAWTVGGSVIGPLAMMQQNNVPNYRAGLQKSLTAWPGLVIVTLLALASASIALGQHRKYHRPHSGLWWWFVFLLGPAGLLAYWLGHPRAVLESCPSCGLLVPRDRDGCAACGETFAAPELLGTEVFA
jgi:hypothetical protein